MQHTKTTSHPARPRLLDAFCGAGGAAVGYWRAGFDVVGVDVRRQPRYPFEFIQADALEWVSRLSAIGFDVVHASPPCQAYSRITLPARAAGIRYPDLLAPTRELLRHVGLPYVIENVPDAPLSGVRLCGTGFGLGVVRHRIFESSEDLGLAPPCCCSCGMVTRGTFVTAAGEGKGRDGFVALAGIQAAMGIDWMRTGELCEAIPPAYTQWVGEQLLRALGLDPEALRRGDALPSTIAICRRCGQPLPSQAATGRPGEFCSQRCRQAAFRERRRERAA